MLLTIAIPTYNRAALLKKCLEYIIPKIDENVEILICDKDTWIGQYNNFRLSGDTM